MSQPNRIAVLRPKIPEAHTILPYLQQIDANRWYGNFGPLVISFEARVAEMMKAQPSNVVMVSNGTLGLTVALQALNVPRGTLCLMPSWTFTATPAAALAAGLEPAFIDVDQTTQAITPEYVKSLLTKTSKPVGAVIPVSPFGSPIDVGEWDRFTEETGIPVVIDAAAAFDSMTNGAMPMGRTPVMVSLHATKICGIGEGGLLLTKSADIQFRIRRIINFGFEQDRLSHRIAINAKSCEYNAAVGLAVLDNWNDIKNGWAAVQKFYCDRLEAANIKCWMSQNWVTSTCNIIVPGQARSLAEKLRELGIDTRRWWETGCHVHPAYREFKPLDALPVTQWLGQSMLGLPGAIDLDEVSLQRVCEGVIANVKPSTPFMNISEETLRAVSEAVAAASH